MLRVFLESNVSTDVKKHGCQPLIDLVKAGNSAAANRIWQHDFDRLVRSVRARLSGQKSSGLGRGRHRAERAQQLLRSS
ncbi:MAG: ECF-type sigma factor [Planctomycetales bacterium]